MMEKRDIIIAVALCKKPWIFQITFIALGQFWYIKTLTWCQGLWIQNKEKKNYLFDLLQCILNSVFYVLFP